MTKVTWSDANTILRITILLKVAEGGRNLPINPFTVDEDNIAIGEKWDEC